MWGWFVLLFFYCPCVVGVFGTKGFWWFDLDYWEGALSGKSSTLGKNTRNITCGTESVCTTQLLIVCISWIVDFCELHSIVFYILYCIVHGLRNHRPPYLSRKCFSKCWSVPVMICPEQNQKWTVKRSCRSMYTRCNILLCAPCQIVFVLFLR